MFHFDYLTIVESQVCVHVSAHLTSESATYVESATRFASTCFAVGPQDATKSATPAIKLNATFFIISVLFFLIWLYIK
jgi:hypothetical protein